VALGQDQVLADLIFQTALRRRQWLTQAQAGFTIVGSRTSPDTQRLREFAARIRLLHVWVDLDSDPAGNDVLERAGASRADAPVVVMCGGETLRNPTNAELARAAGFGSRPTPGKIYDLAVIGAGPAGLAASVYATSEGLSTAIIDSLGVGGQIGTTSRIENYLGFPVGVSGDEFAERALVQVQRFGAKLLVPSTAIGLSSRDDGYVIRLEQGYDVTARGVIVATGVQYRKLDVPGLQRFDRVAVFYSPLAANEVDPGQPVVIVGGGNSAAQAATWLAHRGNPVTIVIRDDDLAANMSRYLVERIARQPGIEVMCHSAVREFDGGGRLERVVVEDLATSARRTVAASAALILIGAVPHTHWLVGSVELDRSGYVVTGADLGAQIRHRPAWARSTRDPYLLETSLPGVFAAGDVRSGSVKRVASAVGQGSIAALFVSEHLNRQADLVPAGRSAL
jgi:thioredoxin reductase (NADPH)